MQLRNLGGQVARQFRERSESDSWRPRYGWLHVVSTIVAVVLFESYPAPAQDEAAAWDLEHTYPIAIRPLLERHCFECHGDEVAEADLDLSRFKTTADIRPETQSWIKVAQMLDSGQMPPPDALQLGDADRERLQHWVRGFLKGEAARSAGDPGAIVLRRLNNAEYAYAVRDLTGIASLNPTGEFPVDGAAGEGFTNVGSGQGMSPALVQKYLDAAKQVAEHVVFLPDGIRFSPHTTQRDQTNELLGRIQAFYRQFSADGGGLAVNLQGIELDTNQGGLLPLEQYLDATLAERDAITNGRKSIEQVARERSLNERYLGLLWKTLSSREQALPSPLIDTIRREWERTTADGTETLVSRIQSLQGVLWKFNPVGHLVAGVDVMSGGKPKSWMEAVDPLTTRQELRLKLPESQGKNDEVLFYLVANDAGDGRDADVVTWKSPRLEASGRSPLLLRDAVGLVERIAQLRRRMLQQTANYLAAAADMNSGADVETVASKHAIDAQLLKVWLEYLAIGGEPVEVQGHFTEQMVAAANYGFINGWGTSATPSIVANSSDQEVRIPGIAKPHSLVAHPSPTLFAAIGWRSPITGTVRIDAHVADAHPECGNGVEYFVQHRSSAKTDTLWQGDMGVGAKATMPSQDLSVKKGDLVSLLIGPRHGEHGCDLTELNLVISETTAANRVWDLAQEVSADILASNPRADKLGHEATWHFYQGEMSQVQVEISRPMMVPVGSALAQWQAEEDADRRAILANRVQSLATGELTAASDSPDGILSRQLQQFPVPLDHTALFEGVQPDARFGRNSPASDANSADLVVEAPSVVEFRIPAELALGRELVVTGELEASRGAEGSVQLQLLTEEPRDLSFSPSLPVIVAEGSEKRKQWERALHDFRQLFPAALCYARIVPVDEVVTLTLFHREDEHLRRLMLDHEQTAQLDRLWDELYYVSQEPIALTVAFEQISEFATQDRPDLVEAFAPLRKPLNDRADAFRRRVLETQPMHVNAVLEFADRAWRRPLTDAERQGLNDLYQGLRTSELSHEDAIRLTLARVLTSPACLFKLEQPAPGSTAKPVTDLELATRLSYFLWSSVPDDELRRVAEAGRLTDDEMLVAQARRLLQSPHIRRLAIEFACQWMHVRDFDKNDDKNEALYPEFADLRHDMYEETVRFFEDMFRCDRSILEIVDADHAFLNSALARHYGLSVVDEGEWRRVEGVRNQGRGGILGMATFLASQSGASRTSPILRGNWVYETLLGERLPRPPANVPQLPETPPSGLTERELIEQHSSVAECAKCHVKIDPYGFALEQYDAIGRLRPEKVDTRATLVSGKTVEGIEGLRDYLMQERRNDVVRQFCRKLLGYALGREVQLADEPLIDTMMKELESHEHRFSIAVEAIVLSDQFRKIRGHDQAEADRDG